MFLKKHNLQLFLAFVAVIVVILIIGLSPRPRATSELKIYFLDVGQGDAAYIKTPSGEDILIDGGPNEKVIKDLSQVMDFGDRQINLVILTHPHADHLTGLVEVLKRYEVLEVWETGVSYPSAVYDNWQKEIADRKIPDKFVQAGDEKNFSEVKILIYSPRSPLYGKKIDNLNNASIVNRLDYKEFSTLFTGDAEKEVQDNLLNKNIFVDILKVAHHGSDNGLSENFLKVVRPAVAIISVSKDNTYGHPAPSVINLLKKYAIRIYRTDQNGTIEITSDGKGYSVLPARF